MFGLRGCQEHYTMNVEDFTLNKDDNDNKFITFAEASMLDNVGASEDILLC